jgi:hypothetical protein
VAQRRIVPDERVELARAASEMRRLSAADRVALFASIMRMIETVWASLPPAERWRRIRIGEQLDGGPRPWWMGVRPDARP